jgi:hypothetical protein
MQASASGFRGVVATLGIVILAVSACTGSVAPVGPNDHLLPLVACQLDAPGAPTGPPGYMLVPPGSIAFGWDGLHNASGSSLTCGAQAVSGARSVIPFSSLDGEDRIPWVAVLAWPGQPTTPDPVPATMTLVRLDPGGEVAVGTQKGSGAQYQMAGNYGHDAEPGSYRMRIVSAGGVLLAEGRFEIVP